MNREKSLWIKRGVTTVLALPLTFSFMPPVGADALKGAAIGAGVGALVGGKKGARNGAIVGAVAGGVKRSKRKKR